MPNNAVKGLGSNGKEKITEKHLKTFLQKSDSFGQDQNECNNVAGSVVQRRQVGSKSGNILFNLVLDQRTRCTTLNWMRVCLAFMDDECIRARIRSQVFSSSIKFNSYTQSAFSGHIEGDSFVLIIVYILEIIPFKDVYRSQNIINIFLFGKKGKLENCLQIKFCIWKYLNKLELGKSIFSRSCVNDAKLLAMYSWPTVAKPCSLQMLKAPSITEGGK